MTVLTAVYGAFLVALGLFAYFGVSSESITALIPAFFGAPVLLIAAIQAGGKFQKMGLIITTVLAVIGLIATVPGLIKLPALLAGTIIPRPDAVMVQSIMCLLSLLYIVPALSRIFVSRAGGDPA